MLKNVHIYIELQKSLFWKAYSGGDQEKYNCLEAINGDMVLIFYNVAKCKANLS